MESIIELCDRIQWLGEHPYAILNAILSNQDLQKKILDLNRIGQLFNKGIDSTGRTLESIGGPYSPFTIEGIPGKFKGKRELGLPTDHITLYNTGEFYKSFKFVIRDNIDNDRFMIEVDPIKDDGTNLLIEWGEDIIGLTEESKEQLREWVNETLVKQTEDFILNGGKTFGRSLSAA